MHFLLDKIWQVRNLSTEPLRALLISESAEVPFQVPKWCHIVDLRQGTFVGMQPTAPTLSSRARPVNLFRQIINYVRYRDWLQNDLQELQEEVQAFIFGSLGENSIGILGDALHLLSQVLKEQKRSCRRKCVFLALHGNHIATEQEQFATIREIARLTFNGPHKAEFLPGEVRLLKEPLIDFWFVLDGTVPHPQADPAALLAEVLFSLLHPSALTLWEHLQNDLKTSAQVREKSRNAVVHTAGIATFSLPVETIRKYFSTRLAWDMLFGKDVTGGGLQGQMSPLTTEQENAILRQWFYVEPFHPFFEWLFNLSSPADFEILPNLGAEYDGFFVSRLIHGLYRSLNQEGTSFRAISQVLERLDKRLTTYQEWLRRARNVSSETVSSIQAHFALWRKVVKALISDIRSWQEAFSGDSLQSSFQSSFPTVTRWDGLASETHSQDEQSAPFPPIVELLKQELEAAEKELQKVMTGSVCRSPIQRQEIERYYLEIVYPDLSDRSRGVPPLYQQLSERLEWWLEMDRNWVPHLLFVCWPPEVSGRSVPEASYSFRPNQKNEIVQALLNLAYSQTAFLQDDLLRLFGQEVRKHPDFLRRAANPYLTFDQEMAYRYANAVLRHAYIITSQPNLGNDLVRDIFPDFPPNIPNVFENGTPTRFTALTFWMNIPLESVRKVRLFQERYQMGALAEWHLSPHERAAVRYEKCWWQLRGERLFIPPELTSLLAEPELVSLFFQAFLTGLISVVRRENGERWWCLNGLYGEMSYQEFLFLSPASERYGLLGAFRSFVIELPNSQDAILNPRSPFHHEQRRHFIHLLRSEIYKRRVHTENFQDLNPQVERELQEWERLATQDPIAAAFWAMLVCELHQPMFI